MKSCKKCRHWQKGKCFPERDDWGMCESSQASRETSPKTGELGTFEDYACKHYERKIWVRM